MMVDEDGDPAPTSMAVSFEQADCVNINADPLCAYMISQDGCDDVTVATGCAKMCGKCAGPFALRQTKEGFDKGMATFSNIAKFHEMPLLAETASFLTKL